MNEELRERLEEAVMRWMFSSRPGKAADAVISELAAAGYAVVELKTLKEAWSAIVTYAGVIPSNMAANRIDRIAKDLLALITAAEQEQKT